MFKSKYSVRFKLSILMISVLIFAFGITTYALLTASVAVENHTFQTGTIEINLNDGALLIQPEEYLFEPGMTVVKDFFIQNDSFCDVYYKIYFENVEGELAEALEVALRDDARTLYRGKLVELTDKNVESVEEALRPGQRKELKAYFYLPTEVGNQTQNTAVYFDMRTDAVQALNNSDRVFE